MKEPWTPQTETPAAEGMTDQVTSDNVDEDVGAVLVRHLTTASETPSATPPAVSALPEDIASVRENLYLAPSVNGGCHLH